MNKGNSVRAYRKWLFNLEILKIKEFEDSIKYELRISPEKGRVIIRYENGEYDCSIIENDFGKKYTENML